MGKKYYTSLKRYYLSLLITLFKEYFQILNRFFFFFFFFFFFGYGKPSMYWYLLSGYIWYNLVWHKLYMLKSINYSKPGYESMIFSKIENIPYS